MILTQRTMTLPFIGARDYLHGPDLFEALTGFLDLPPETGALDYSIHDFIRTNHARLVEVDTPTGLDRAALPTLLIARTPAGPRIAGIGPDPAQHGPRLERPSHEPMLAPLCARKDTVLRAPRLPDLGLLEQAVLMNKLLLSVLLPDLDVRWAFTRAMFTALLPATATHLELICETPRPGRLYRSRLRLDGCDHGTIFFSGIPS
jgi:hypothetical protein